MNAPPLKSSARGLSFHVLGRLEAYYDGAELDLGPRKQRAVLALLLLNANHVVSTERLIDDLWGDSPPSTARAALQVYVAGLRKALRNGGASLRTRAPGYVLELGAGVLDLDRFTQLHAKARESPDVERRAALLHEGLTLWRDAPLPELRAEPFAATAVAQLDQLMLAAIEERVDADLALGRDASLVTELESLVAEHPYRERLRAQLMLALYRSGRQADALDAYQAGRRILQDELGLEPGKELRDLEAAILRQADQLQTPGSTHAFPPLRTLGNPPTNLPVQPTSLIGREPELHEISKLLGREDLYVLTLTGPGGVGKTRLALQVAADLSERYTSGVLFVSLAPILDSNLVVPTIARALGLREQGDDSLIETLREYLRDKEMLLLLDNFEHVLSAAPTILSLRASASRLGVLVTSRTPLRLSGEVTYPVSPLPLPDPARLPDAATLSQYPSLSLFIERARAANPGFTLSEESARAIAEICVRLDGLPLAIELAATHVRALPPQTLLARLQPSLKLLRGGAQDLEARQRTMRSTIDWSYDLLPEVDKRLLARLGIFIGGCRLEAAEDVCDLDREPESDVLDSLLSLVEKSLVQRREDPDGEPRFWMLETIREYALTMLDDELAETARRHAVHYLGLAEAANLRGVGQRSWITRLESDYENLRAALRWSFEHGDKETALRLVIALSLFWEYQFRRDEAWYWHERALVVADSVELDLRAKELMWAGRAATIIGDNTGAISLLQRAADAFRSLGEVASLSATLRWVGILVEPAMGAPMFDEAIQLARDLGDADATAQALHNRGLARSEHDDFSLARRDFEEALALFRASANNSGIANAVVQLAGLALVEGRDEEAEELYEEGLPLAREIDRVTWICDALDGKAHLALRRGDAGGARRLFRESLAIARERRDTGHVAESIHGLAAVATSQGEHARAARMSGAAEALFQRTELGTAPYPSVTDRYLIPGRKALGGEEWDKAHRIGRGLSEDEAIAYALEDDPGQVSLQSK